MRTEIVVLALVIFAGAPVLRAEAQCSAGFGFTPPSTCTICGGGSASPGGSSPCLPCAPGSFTDIIGATTCTLCPPRFFSASPGAVACSVCTAGFYNASFGATTCPGCAEGFFQTEIAATSCEACTCSPAASCAPQTGACAATPVPMLGAEGLLGWIALLLAAALFQIQSGRVPQRGAQSVNEEPRIGTGTA